MHPTSTGHPHLDPAAARGMQERATLPSVDVLGLPVSTADHDDVCDAIAARIAAGENKGYVCAANVHVVVTARRRPGYRQALAAAEFVTCDGMPLVWALRRHGFPHQERVYGPDLMLRWCERAQANGSSIFLYGSSRRVLDRLVEGLHERYPKLRVAGTLAPPFRPLTETEMAEHAAVINASGAAVVFVGLGAPKQELWMHAQAERVNAFMLGVGAAFDFHAGTKPQAPNWMQRSGLEWLFRLGTEPRRLAGRYLVTNTYFIVAMAFRRFRRGRRGRLRVS